MSKESEGAKELPINAFRSRIAEAVRDNAVVVLIGETGSGKTTQLPQILADEGFVKGGMVGVTQPRRMAAVSVARRVAWERKCEVGEEVGYAVRFEERASRQTRIKYLTDGTLLREFLFDPNLSRYDVVMLDEAHERSLNTDILLGLMKRLLASRRQHGFRVVVTSATLDTKKVAAYFGSCPVLSVPGRVYPVKVVHSLEDHSQAYEQAAVDTALDIHVTRPEGDILIFLTGQAEVEGACRKLRCGVEALAGEDAGPLLVLPLYAALPPDLQARVFAPAPPGCRRCVVATNVAETSVTVDGVVYVVDAGMVKVREYDSRTGMDSLKVKPISRVQAAQRTGRAGRTRPGMCFRLFTKEAHEEMPEEAVPEIQRTSLMGAVLHLKNLLLDIDVLAFDYLDPPKRESLEEALLQLYVVDAIDGRGRITPLGKAMVQLPLDPSLCRALLAATDLDCLQDALTVAAMLSCEQIVLPGREHRGGQAEGHDAGGSAALREFTQDGLGDHIFLLRLYQAWSEAGFSAAFAKQLGLNLRSLNFARDVRKQLHRVCSEHLRKLGPQPQRKRRREGPGDTQACGEELRRMPSALERDRRDHWDAGDAESEPEAIDSPPEWRLTRPRGMTDLTALRKALAVGFANKVARRMPRHNGYRVCNEKGQLAMVHPACAELAEDDEGMQPDFLIFHELHASGARCFLRHVCAINGDWVARQLAKLRDADVACLGSGKPSEKKKRTGLQESGGKAAENASGKDAAEVRDGSRRNTEQTVSDARARYLARKAARK